MSFYYKNLGEVEIDDLIDTIIATAKLNSWTEPDVGYKVIRNPDETFDIKIALEATNKRYLQFEIGVWDDVSHAWSGAYVSCGFVIADTSTGHPAGTEKGACEFNCDTNKLNFWGDFTANGASYRRNFIYAGLAKAQSSNDAVLLLASHLFRGTNAIPTNDATVNSTLCVLKDINGISNKPIYSCYIVQQMASGAKSQEVPRGQVLSIVSNLRLVPEIYIGSNTSISSGEDSGIRASFYDLYHGFYDDAEAHGITAQGNDLRTFKYWKHVTDFNYTNLPTQIFIRVS